MSNVIDFKSIITEQRNFFNSGKTKDVNFRIRQLKLLASLLSKYENDIISAVYEDLKKPEYEGFITEIGGTRLELNYALKNVKKWAKPKKIRAPLSQFKGSGKIFPEPKGLTLIIGPWNYPFNLLLTPLIGTISAGNCAIIKPSELAPKSSKVIASIINSNFAKEYIYVIEGDAETVKELMNYKFDHVFFTGGSRIGKIIMELASKNLSPVTLELGGKSPCIVDNSKNLNFQKISDYIISAKYLNCGSTCIAVDYVMIHKNSKDQLIEYFKKSLEKFYGSDIEKSPDYGRIINISHFKRLVSFIDGASLLFGGKTQESDLYIEPTLIELTLTDGDKPVMQEEIFGPILPVIVYQSIDDVIKFINSKSKPLALYLFSNDKTVQNKVISEVPFGGGSINDTLVHPSLPNLPFGGIGDSGIGSYHGKYSFETFSHLKSVFYRSTRFDFTKKYREPPYKNKLKFVKRFIG